jgi:hypothetical protein
MPYNQEQIKYLLLQAFLIVVLASFAVVMTSAKDTTIVIVIFTAALFLLYYKDFEFFILSVLIINQEFFYLVSRTHLDVANYRDLLYILLPFLMVVYLFKRIKLPRTIFLLILAFFIVIFIAVINATQQGQPLLLGLKAAKGYYLILYFFIFFSRPINIHRLTRIIVITGVLLMILNNIQYIAWDSIKLFEYIKDVDVIRGGRRRFLMGDFFTIFAPIIALGAYLQQKKRWYLVAFLYMTATIIVQGQTRAVIFGLMVATLMLFFIGQRIRIRVIVGALLIVAGFILFEQMLQDTFIGSLFQETRLELTQKSGNIGIRYDAYDYYWNEISQHIVIGRGIWNDAFTDYNPEDMKYRNLHLSDIGIMNFFFHTGLIGLSWLIMLLVWVYRKNFRGFGKLHAQINYGIIGYFIFSLATMATLNCLTDRFTIIYLALALAIITQYDRSSIKTASV